MKSDHKSSHRAPFELLSFRVLSFMRVTNEGNSGSRLDHFRGDGMSLHAGDCGQLNRPFSLVSSHSCERVWIFVFRFNDDAGDLDLSASVKFSPSMMCDDIRPDTQCKRAN